MNVYPPTYIVWRPPKNVEKKVLHIPISDLLFALPISKCRSRKLKDRSADARNFFFSKKSICYKVAKVTISAYPLFPQPPPIKKNPEISKIFWTANQRAHRVLFLPYEIRKRGGSGEDRLAWFGLLRVPPGRLSQNFGPDPRQVVNALCYEPDCHQWNSKKWPDFFLTRAFEVNMRGCYFPDFWSFTAKAISGWLQTPWKKSEKFLEVKSRGFA